MSKYFIILFCLAAILCSAQTVKPKAVARKPAIARKTTFAIISRPYQDSISLRWVLGDYNSWLLSKRFGYDIYRASISTDTSDFIKLNEEPILPVSEDEFNQKYLKDPIASKAAFSCIHSGDTPDKNLKEAIGKSDARSMTFAMAILAANIYPKVAKISGMMYVDKNIQKGKKYLYKIVLSPKANFKLAATTTVTTGDAYEIPQIAGFVGKSLGKSAQLKWQK
ncbi:MAG: hypothetical protein H7329_11620, partial [Opitutaceae bacterium]|nr:hypothetical protein [Cytophagales bacterium]